ncbi:tRNA pseudouridine(38/39) synthase isoform X2 [Orussus abietinus]|uniref:tRNA pseudouridine(38/39) synthase isoform X2 n=1 Tax=Orussus abietinus TaxID=222816 RepID=UPI000C716254|nr:tRNA pseudouridine(38/39) synthase isoform X2 [Orussus abietinus]
MADISYNRGKIAKACTREELELLDKKSLINRIMQLEAHNQQLRRIITKKSEVSERKSMNEKPRKQFDFSRCYTRHILLKFYYLGWDYHGFVEQEGTQNTIEYHLFKALKKSCCIESRENCNYHRCGRTDKGVSAFSQTISLDIRSKLSPENQHNLQEELPYCKLLNRLLPRDIRCVAWSPAQNNVSARFNCKYRTYKYLFPRGDLNVKVMNEATKYLLGHHDFRNFCKMDVANGVTRFDRTISTANISEHRRDFKTTSSYDICELTITSQAFLWHQIRCIMGILFLIGQEKESPRVICDLLDTNICPRKPQYNLAHELPLCLMHCEFENQNWFIDNHELTNVITTLQQDWTLNAIKAAMTREMLREMETILDDDEGIRSQSTCLLQGVQTKVYQPLMKRVTCDSLEDKIQHYAKKRKPNTKGFESAHTSQETI